MSSTVLDPCVAINGDGIAYREFSCDYPQLQPFYFEFEKKYDPIPVLDWMRYHSMAPVYAVVLYGVLIATGQYAMRNREAWNWRRFMALWNLTLSVFSWIGMFRTLPQLLHNLYYMSVRDNLCMDRKFPSLHLYQRRYFVEHLLVSFTVSSQLLLVVRFNLLQ